MFESAFVRQLLAGFAGTMSLAGAGFGFGWPSPSLPKLLAGDGTITVTSDESSWIVSAFTIGCALGSCIGSIIVDYSGRKLLLLSTIIPYIIACILIGTAQNVWMFIIGRIICGIGSGMGYSVVPMYTGEISDPRIRGAISGMLDPVVNIAVVLIYCVGPWISVRNLAIVGGALPIVFGLMFIWMPESPYFLVMKKKYDQAEQSLKWLKGNSDVSEDLKIIQENIESERKNGGKFKDLIMIPGNRKALIIVIGLITAQQFSGISAIVAYSSLIFEASGSPLNSSISVIIIGVVQVSAGVLTVFTVDCFGRRLLLLASTFGSFVFLIGLALYYQLQAIGADISSISWLPVTAMMGFIIICTLGLGTLPHVVLSEIFPCNVKAFAVMVMNIVGSLIAVFSTKIYQIVADAYGIHASFWCYAILTIFSGIFIYFKLPETKQRTLQDIQDELHKIPESRINLSKCDE